MSEVSRGSAVFGAGPVAEPTSRMKHRELKTMKEQEREGLDGTICVADIS